MYRFLLTCLLLLTAPALRAQYFDTLRLYYPIGSPELDRHSRQALDSLIRYQGGRRILIYGHADYLGTENPNQLLSERRARTVLQYLVANGFKETQVMQCVGAGQLKNKSKMPGEEGNPDSRKTEIFLIKEKSQLQRAPEQGPPPKTTAEHLTKKIDYKNLKVGDTLKLDNINFYAGTPIILPASYDEVDNLYEMLRSHPGLKICLEGHVCCCVYPDGYFPNTPHWALSVQRARQVRNLLVKRGIKAERLQYKGFGRTHPIVDIERTSEEGQVNRRVEIRILEK